MKTPRDNLLQTLNRQGYEWIPLDINLCPSQVEAFKKRFGHDNYLKYFNVPVRTVNIRMVSTYTDGRELFINEELPDNTDIDEWGVGHSHGSETAMHMTRMHHPLAGERTLSELMDYPLPEIAPDELSRLTTEVQRLHELGLAVRGDMALLLWEIGWYIRGMNELMMDMIDEEDKTACWFDRLAELAVKRAELYAQAGCDILLTGDDIGMQQSIMMSVDMWSRWIKPRFKRIITAAKNVKPDIKVFYHSCGYIIPFIEGLIKIGIDILNPVQPECMDFRKIYDIAAGRLSFWGTIGTQTTLPFGTPEDVRKTVRNSVDICGKQGGLVIAPTHLIEPEVPWENLQALKELNNAANIIDTKTQ